MNELNKRKKEFLKAYNNLCSCYGDIISEQTKVSCNILAEKAKLQKQLAIAVEGLKDVIETVKTGFVVCDACGFQEECRDCAAQIVAEQTLDEIKELKQDD